MARSALACALALLFGPFPVAGQDVTWEMLPLFPGRPQTSAVAVDFLRGEGTLVDDPAADTLVWIGSYGAFLYNPSGAAGAAGPNGEWGVWHRLCSNGQCASPTDGLVTASGTLVMGSPAGPTGLARGTDRGRTWALNYEEGYGAFPFFQTEHAEPVGAVFAGIGDGGETARSLADGAPGSWAQVGTGLGYPVTFGEVPPSPPLPQGRLLLGVWGGVRRSDDGGLTYTAAQVPSSAYYIVWSLAFVPDPSHPYGGSAYAGAQNVSAGGEFAGAEVLRSDDGGTTWQLAHRFTAAEVELPVPEGADMTAVELLAAPDGVLWAGVGHRAEIPNRGGVMRSTDGGATWERADAGFRDASGRGYRVNDLAVSRTGVLYAATERGVWRTTGPVVADEPGPGEGPGGVGVTVSPNPAGGRVEVAVTLAEGGSVRVVVLDALGREVAVVLAGEGSAGERSAFVDVSGWPAGVYVVRATAGARVVTARLVVAR